jgi:hypothetical protein
VRLGRYYRYRVDAIEAFEIGADTVGDNEHRAAGARLASPPARPTGA